MKITIYSTTDCAACHSLTEWLKKQGQEYDMRIVDTDPKLMQEFMTASEGMIAVPFSVITTGTGEQTKISGFDLPKFKTALGVQ